eukprot:g613.t1
MLRQCFPTTNAISRMLTTKASCDYFDVIIVGGGIMGSSAAFWLLNLDPSLKVAVVERDPTYELASTPRSVGSIRQQFSIKGNVLMSQFSAKFLDDIGSHLSFDDNEADCGFTKGSYLFLSTPEGKSILEENWKLQTSLGAKVQLLDEANLKEKFEWLETSDLAAGVVGLEDEGWFDPWMLLSCFKKKAISLGAKYIHGDVNGFKVDSNSNLITGVSYLEEIEGGSKKKKTESYSRARFVVNAAGASAAQVVSFAGVDNNFPVEARKRQVFVVHCPNGPKLDCPLVVDPSGVYFRREGSSGNFLCGRSPNMENDPSTNSMEVEHDFFDEYIWPYLAQRAPVFNELKVINSWAGSYEYNTFDQNAILGAHPLCENFYLMNGFSGHGAQQAPAAGLATAELILHGEYRTLQLNEFGYQRILDGKLLKEKNVV